MKKGLLITLLVMLVGAPAAAAPLTDYSAGKTAIDLTYRQSEVNTYFGRAFNPTFDEKYNLDLGLTVGLGNNFAFQYTHYNAKSKDTDIQGNIWNARVKTQEFNILHKISNNISIYTGIVRTDVNANTSGFGDVVSAGKDIWQLGLSGSTKLNGKTTAYASAGTGVDFLKWKLGLAYEVAPSLELNLDYQCIKANVNDDNVGRIEAKAKGFGMGLTYKF